MVALISILVVVLGFILQSNKQYTWFMLVWMWILFAFNTLNGDYLAYEMIYKRIAANDSRIIKIYEEFFVLLCQMGSKVFHWNYQQFIVFMATFSTILFAVVIKLYCDGVKQNLVISLFMIFLYWMFICQYRTYIALLFVLVGLYCLYRIDDWKGPVLFVLFVIVGAAFHRMAALFIVLIAAKFINVNRLIIAVPIIMAVVSQIRNPAFSSFLSRYVAGYKMDRWLYSEGSRTWTGIIILIIVRVLMVGIEYHCYNKRKRININNIYLKSQEYILKITIICLGMLPLEFIKKDYERLARLPLFLSFVFLAEYLKSSRIDKRHLPLNAVTYAGYLGLYMISFYTSFYGWFIHNLVPIMRYNSLVPFS